MKMFWEIVELNRWDFIDYRILMWGFGKCWDEYWSVEKYEVCGRCI